jgi:hypothetical protein
VILAALSFVLASACEVRADLSFVQVVQAQSSRGEDGVFGKSWVELRGRRMRIVSGYARKMARGKTPDAPRRVIQLLDLGEKTRVLVLPERRAYVEAAFSDIDYGDLQAKTLKRTSPAWTIAASTISFAEESDTRRFLEADCAHYRITAELELAGAGGRRRKARMEQHVWVAPVSGELSATLLELMAFENGYREAAGGGLSPLDHERYQIREAAAYLGVRAEELRRVALEARARMRGLPNYPVASLVAWRASPAPSASRPPARMRVLRARPRMIDWSSAERAIDRLYSDSRLDSALRRGRRRARRRPAAVYPRFEAELHGLIFALMRERKDQRLAPEPARLELEPFYEIYAEFHGLDRPAQVPEGDLGPPAHYRRMPPKSP